VRIGLKDYYIPSKYGMELDFCRLSEGARHPLLKTFLPNLHESMASVLHPCPYSVSLKKKIY
jgi:hypothetical protein